MNNIKIGNENDIIFYEDKDHNKKAEIRLDMVKWKCNCEHFSCVKQVSHTIKVHTAAELFINHGNMYVIRDKT